jgi:hypothetical protein
VNKNSIISVIWTRVKALRLAKAGLAVDVNIGEIVASSRADQEDGDGSHAIGFGASVAD